MALDDSAADDSYVRWGGMRRRLATWWFEPEILAADPAAAPADGPTARQVDSDSGYDDSSAATLPTFIVAITAPVAGSSDERLGGDMNGVDTAMKEALDIEGATGVALVDYTSGMTLGKLSNVQTLDLDVAAAGNTEVVRAKLRTMESLGIQDAIEDILITLGRQYHLIRLLSSSGGHGLFLYLVLDKTRANLAMARHRLRLVETRLDL